MSDGRGHKPILRASGNQRRKSGTNPANDPASARARRPKLSVLCKKLDHQFEDEALLNEALTHRSAAARNNERLEFLGDSILGVVISAELFRRRPQSPEGDLSRLRSHLVRGTTLAEIGRDLDLGSYLILGSGEMKAGGHRRASILAGTVEAVLGAIYMDAGFDVAEASIQRLFASRLDSLPDTDNLKDPKTRLQEWLQSRSLSLPSYAVLEVTGEQHNQRFRVQCLIPHHGKPVEGEGGSRRKAEQQAAQLMLEVLSHGE